MSSNDDNQEAPEAGFVAEGMARATSTRRDFMQTAGLAAGAATLAGGCNVEWERFFQKHYRFLTDEDKREIFARIEAETLERTGVEVNIKDPQAIPGVQYGYGLNVSYCIGCRRCEYACVAENNQSRDPQVHYIRVLEMEQGSFDVEQSDHFYEGEVPEQGKYYLPVQCHQCADAPCTRACPVEATWQEPDGIIVVDYDWCIGCRYCEAACPYFARRFNFAVPSIPPSEINPDQAYLSNRIRPAGVVEKCTFCLHRTREGRYPACVEVCPTGSRKFGNMADPNSEIRHILETKRIYIFKEELGTHPRFFYFFD